jgi:hypothetical protein
MQAATLLKYVKDPGLLDKASVKQLQGLVNDFPYFEGAHLLLSMAARKWDASVYQQTLKKTAIVVTNRAHLFELIHNFEDPLKPEKEVPQSKPGELQTEVKHELDILKAAEISVPPATPSGTTGDLAEKNLEKEIAKQVVNAFVEKEILKTHELNKPKPEAQPASFGDWLSYLKKNNGQSYGEIEQLVIREKEKQHDAGKEGAVAAHDQLSRKQKQKALIEKIIEQNPGPIRAKEEQKFFTPETQARESLLDNEHLITETLAQIYALQGNVNKAVRAYQILSLKFPQKSAYFASLIQKLKNNQ